MTNPPAAPEPAAYPQQAGAPQPYAPAYQGAQAPARTNPLAIVTLVLSLVGVSIGAVITGHISLKQIARTGEQGHGLALAGLIIGYLGCLGWILFWILGVIVPLVVYGSIVSQIPTGITAP